MPRSAVLGLPRIGPDRELKFALESYWAGKTGSDELAETARGLRAANWKRAAAAGIDAIPCGDFSLYDHVLDTAWALGAIPARFGALDRRQQPEPVVVVERPHRDAGRRGQLTDAPTVLALVHRDDGRA